ncbi:MAG: DUF4968 domain-containing protein, partial [Lachnospiraceae bacterium]|nr:DUF4968 domain-containing protein [Lachnospiraceae bacterium]
MLTAIHPKNSCITSVKREMNSLVLKSERQILEITPVTESIVRIRATVRDAFSETERPGVICNERYLNWEHAETAETVTLSLPKLELCLVKATCSVTYRDGSGRILLREREPDAREYEEFETYMLDAHPQTKIIQTADGAKEVLEDPKKLPAGKSLHIRYHFVPGDED